jgi:hypothetical protein
MRVEIMIALLAILTGCSDCLDEYQAGFQENAAKAVLTCEAYGQEPVSVTTTDGETWTAICLQRDPAKVFTHEVMTT